MHSICYHGLPHPTTNYVARVSAEKIYRHIYMMLAKPNVQSSHPTPIQNVHEILFSVIDSRPHHQLSMKSVCDKKQAPQHVPCFGDLINVIISVILTISPMFILALLKLHVAYKNSLHSLIIHGNKYCSM